MHTKQEFVLTAATKWDRKADSTYVGVRISGPRVFTNPSPEWEKYLAECGESLDQVAAKESIEIQEWSTDLGCLDGLTEITHHVDTRGLLTGVKPNLIQRAQQPARGYATLDLLAGALNNDLRIDAPFKHTVKTNCLKRYDRKGKPLPDPIPEQLFARALSEPGWRGLVSPRDKPWAYINTATRRIYERSYAEETGAGNPLEDAGLSRAEIDKQAPKADAGDELFIENLRDVVLNSGCSTDAASVMVAREIGKKWKELPKYLTGTTGTKWDRRRVEAARASIGRHKDALRACAWAASQWKGRSGQAAIYRERLPGGGPWNGSWIYSHSLQGANVDIYGEVMAAERKNLFVTK
jgi:hypothetical protein